MKDEYGSFGDEKSVTKKGNKIEQMAITPLSKDSLVRKGTGGWKYTSILLGANEPMMCFLLLNYIFFLFL